MTIYDMEFPDSSELGHSKILHFNHAGIAPWPQRSINAISRFAQENYDVNYQYIRAWDKAFALLKKQCAELIGAASADEIGFVKNTSEGLSIVAGGIPWQAKDNLVIGNIEFSSNQMAWRAFAERFNIELRVADIAVAKPEEALIAQMDSNTRLLACSSIQYASGYRMDLVTLGKACKKHKALFCIDAIQSLGAVPFKVQDYGADFVCADGHKWLLSPEGTGLFYCKQKHIKQLNLNQFGWKMVENPTQYDRLDQEFSSKAQRFECGSINHLGLIGLQASLELLFEIGIDNVHRKITRNITYLIERIDQSRFEIVTPLPPEKRGGILMLRLRKGDNEALYRTLLDHQILCAYRRGGIRLSPHFYISKENLDQVLLYLHS